MDRYCSFRVRTVQKGLRLCVQEDFKSTIPTDSSWKKKRGGKGWSRSEFFFLMRLHALPDRVSACSPHMATRLTCTAAAAIA